MRSSGVKALYNRALHGFGEKNPRYEGCLPRQKKTLREVRKKKEKCWDGVGPSEKKKSGGPAIHYCTPGLKAEARIKI